MRRRLPIRILDTSGATATLNTPKFNPATGVVEWSDGTTGGGVAVEDEGVEVSASASRVNFTGDGVTVTDDGAGGVDVAIPGSGPGGGGSVRNVDDPADPSWGAASAYDAEFDTDGTSLPAGWSWVNQGSSTFERKFGAGILTIPAVSGDNLRMLARSLPTEATWTATAKLTTTTKFAGITLTFLALRESTSGKLITFDLMADAPVSRRQAAELAKWNSPTAYAGSSFVTPVEWAHRLAYLRVRRNSAASWDFGVSADGITWETVAAAVNVPSFLTPDQIAFGFACGNSRSIQGACHWFRVR